MQLAHFYQKLLRLSHFLKKKKILKAFSMSWGSWVKELLLIHVNFFIIFIIWDYRKSRMFVLNPGTTILPGFDYLKSFSFFRVIIWNTLVVTFFRWKILCSIFSIDASKQWELVALTRKLDVLITFFVGRSSNCCLWMLVEDFVADGLEF